jgi:hypothetical protein
MLKNFAKFLATKQGLRPLSQTVICCEFGALEFIYSILSTLYLVFGAAAKIRQVEPTTHIP